MKEQRKPRWGERGNFSLLAGLSLVLLLGFGALVIDVGVLYWTKSRGQDAAQAAALAAAKDLDGTPGGAKSACETARVLVEHNSQTLGEYRLRLSCTEPFAATNDVILGTWDEQARRFLPQGKDAIPRINAVQLRLTRTEAKGNGVAPMLASVFTVFGADVPRQLDVNVSATAALVFGGPASAADGIFPLAARPEAFLKPDGSVACGREVVLGANVACTQNPADCLRESNFTELFNWTTGQAGAFDVSSIQDAANAATECVQGKAESCGKFTFSVGDALALLSGKQNDFFRSTGAFAEHMASGRSLLVQLPIFSPLAQGGRIIGTGSLNFVEYVTSTEPNGLRFLRGVVACGQETKEPGNLALTNFGTAGRPRLALVE